MAVDSRIRRLKGPAKVAALSRCARKAVHSAALLSGCRLSGFHKDDYGKPLPVDGVFWSLSHKSEYVAGVVSREAVGIDIEKIRDCSEALHEKIADHGEWQICVPKGVAPDATTFFRYWTAKEAVLKTVGIGLRGLTNCRIERIVDETHLVVAYSEKKWLVEHCFFNDHVVSVVVSSNNVVNWHIMRNASSELTY